MYESVGSVDCFGQLSDARAFHVLLLQVSGKRVPLVSCDVLTLLQVFQVDTFTHSLLLLCVQ